MKLGRVFTATDKNAELYYVYLNTQSIVWSEAREWRDGAGRASNGIREHPVGTVKYSSAKPCKREELAIESYVIGASPCGSSVCAQNSAAHVDSHIIGLHLHTHRACDGKIDISHTLSAEARNESYMVHCHRGHAGNAAHPHIRSLTPLGP